MKANPLVEAVSVIIDEKIVAVVSKDGDFGKFEVKGEIFLYVNDENKANAEVHLTLGDTKGVAIKPHPELNRALWNSQQIIAPKQGASGFPVNTKLEALKYKYTGNNSNDLPFSITVWSSTEDKLNVVTVEAEFNTNSTKFTHVGNLKLTIPLGAAKEPEVTKQVSLYVIDNEDGKFGGELFGEGAQTGMEYREVGCDKGDSKLGIEDSD